MPYIEGRVVHDADAHIMEEPTWLLEPRRPGRARAAATQRRAGAGARRGRAPSSRCSQRHADPEFRSRDAEEIMARKNFKATGATIAADRPLALDLLGVASQLVFNTFNNGHLLAPRAERRPRPRLRRRPRPQPRDGRVLLGRPPPAAHLLRAAGRLRAVGGDGRRGHRHGRRRAAGAQRPAPTTTPPATSASTRCGGRRRRPASRSSSTWAAAGSCSHPKYFVNGGAYVPDFHGGDENFRSVDYMAIPGPPAQTLATMIFDGVLERHPSLQVRRHRAGRHLAAELDAPDGVRLRRLREARAAPAGPVAPAERVRPPPDQGHAVPHRGRGLDHRAGGRRDVALFSTDFPHVEGGRRPFERFEASLGDASEAVRQAFYCDNFVDLMGHAIDGLPLAV